ncbi:MAG: dihydropteridine reductase [Clostridia bacterium]|nr:dihydropteridine reductase [Clostridia bacterium]
MNQREQVRKIAESYETKTPSGLDKLKKLDEKIRRPSTIFAYVFGTLASLVLGVGMCLAMKVLGDLMAVGIVIGVVGIIMCLINYPIYKKMLSNAKIKNADKIKELSNKILNV